MPACVHACNEFPRGAVIMEFLRRSIVETNRANRPIPDGNNGNRVESGKTFLSLGVHTHTFSLFLSLLVLNKMRIFIPSRSKQDWD